MIEIETELQIPAEAFFRCLTDSVKYDIAAATGENAEALTLYSGYCYRKAMKNKLGQRGGVEVEIVSYEPPSRYGVSFQDAAGGLTQIEYTVRSLREDCICVRYTEDYRNPNRTQTLNYKIVSALYRRSARKRAARMLHSMEAFVKNQL